MKKQPAFDSDHYPSEETLTVIKNWDYEDNFIDLMEYVEECWEYPDYFIKEETKDELFGHDVIKYNCSTGGWSGNESLICTLQENRIFWAMNWVQSKRGGHYIFEIRLDNK